eukprot:366227-Chlamydomonas_euryale.AAC.37
MVRKTVQSIPALACMWGTRERPACGEERGLRVGKREGEACMWGSGRERPACGNEGGRGQAE